MESLSRTCEDCGDTITMEISRDKQPSTNEQVEVILQEFDGYIVQHGWKYVKYGFFNLNRKWLCSKCKLWY